MQRHGVSTKDQSPTLFVPGLNQHYHSLHGAEQESRHVFINAGFHQFRNLPSVNILEMGFGTGLNALLTVLEAEKQGQKVFYHGLEKYPLSREEAGALDYSRGNADRQKWYHALHNSTWEAVVKMSDNFHILKQKCDLRQVHLPGQKFQLIYFDAFAPTAQDYLWTPEIFKKMHACLSPGGILVSYCVKGSVRRNLQAAGFAVEKIPGPPGKREMLRAGKG